MSFSFVESVEVEISSPRPSLKEPWGNKSGRAFGQENFESLLVIEYFPRNGPKTIGWAKSDAERQPFRVILKLIQSLFKSPIISIPFLAHTGKVNT